MDVDVLIVGAGPTGLALALQLARFGTSFRIIDAGREATDLSKAVGVQARTLETLDMLGLADSLIARGNKANSFHIYDDGAEILTVDVSELESRFPFLLVVPQSETERVMLESLEKSGVTVERETTLTRFTQDDSGVVATYESADRLSRTVHARWIVGCDGAHSAVRHIAELPFEGEEYADGFMLADVKVDWDRSLDHLYLFLKDGWLTAFFGFADRRYRIICDLPPDQAPPEQTPTLEDCQRLVNERVPFPVRLSDPKWTANYRIHRRIVPHLREGRAFVAGDAAHIHSPAAAQGMNTGIQDATNLGWKLAMAAAGISENPLLESYNEERYPAERAVLQGTDTLLKMMSLRQPVARSIRDHLLPLLSSAKPIRHILRDRISEIGISYRGSSLVAEHDHSSGAKAGDRAPDGPLIRADGSEVRLYELLRQSPFVWLVFADDGDAYDAGFANTGSRIPETLRPFTRPYIVTRRSVATQTATGDVAILRDPPGLITELYGVTHPCLRVIRPDGYIGLRADARSLKAREVNAWVVGMRN